MGSCFSSKQRAVKIRIIDNIQKENRFDYLRPRGEIIVTIDRVYNFPMLNIIFDD